MSGKVAIIDADSMVFIVGFGNAGTSLKYQCSELDNFLANILEKTGCDTYVGYLTGDKNFRYDVATIQPYKGNRDSTQRPEFEKELKNYLADIHGFHWTDGIEADDACGIAAYSGEYEDFVIAHIDKDLDMLEGQHYDYKKDKHYHVDKAQGWRNFYLQVLTGDSGDNIPGLYKITGVKAMKKFKEPLDEMEVWGAMDVHCWDVYLDVYEGDEEELLKMYKEIKQLLWILRRPLDSRPRRK